MAYKSDPNDFMLSKRLLVLWRDMGLYSLFLGFYLAFFLLERINVNVKIAFYDLCFVNDQNRIKICYIIPLFVCVHTFA